MKKVMLTLLVALAVPAFAADVQLSDGGVITLTVGAGEVVRGIGIVVTSENDITAVANGADAGLGNTFNVFMDAAHDAGETYDFEVDPGSPVADPAGAGVLAPGAGVKAVSLCMGVLDTTGAQAGAGEGVYEIATIATEGLVTVTIDELRGGIVGDDVTADPDGTPLATATVGGGGVCAGDVTGAKDGIEVDPITFVPTWTGNLDDPDGDVDLTDLAAVVNILVNEGGAGYSVTDPATVAKYATADVTGSADGIEVDPITFVPTWTGNLDAPNGAINLTDLAAVVNILVNEGGAGYNASCPWK